MKHHIATGLKAGLIAFSLTSLGACGGGGMSTTELAPSAASATARKVPAMSVDVHKRIQKAQEAIDRKDYATAKALLAETLGLARVNDYERAIAWQLRAMIAYEEDNVADTIAAYEQILEFSQSIPEALELAIIYGLAQLHYSEGQYDTAADYLETWEQRQDPSLIRANDLTFMSNIHYVRNDFAAAIAYIDKAIAIAESLPRVEARESWYLLSMSAHWEIGDYEGVRTLLDQLLHAWPKPSYCIQRAGIETVVSNVSEQEAIVQVKAHYPTCQTVDFASAPEFPALGLSEMPMPSGLSNRADRQRDYLPLVRIQPQYPRKAVEEKVSGYVVIELTVNPDGSVDPDSLLVLESEPKGYFEQAALSAASKFRYKPKRINGVPQKVTGVKYRFGFELAD